MNVDQIKKKKKGQKISITKVTSGWQNTGKDCVLLRKQISRMPVQFWKDKLQKEKKVHICNQEYVYIVYGW